MATPRKHWFRVADSILFEGWDDNQLATMVRLSAYLNTRWAREGRTPDEACRAVLDAADLAKITGKRRRDVALKSLQRLANVTAMSVEVRGEVAEIFWPKWSDFQQLRSPSSPETAPSARRPRKTQDAPADTRERRRKPARVCPDHLTDGEREAIARWALEQPIPIPREKLGPAWGRFRDWAISKDERKQDWAAAFRNALSKGWVLDGGSAAQQRVDRTKQAAREAVSMLTTKPLALAIVEGGKG